MNVLGLTGGVGMGKSTAARFFSDQGVRVVDTDDLARQLAQPGQASLKEIKAEFGNQILDPQGGLRRDELARIVFADAGARKRLEAILHPRIRECWLARVESWRGEKCALAVVVIPLLFETHAESHFDKIICVACSASAQRQRLLDRGWSQDQIRQRIAAQMPVEQKLSRSHFVVWTEGDLDVHARQLDRIRSGL
jgi:dephospho-CoA kinase